MKAVVTGGKGFIGTHLVAVLKARGDAVEVVDLPERDIREPGTYAQALAGADVVYHLAAVVSVQKSIEEPLAAHSTNVDGLLAVLEAARLAGVRKFVFASSAAIYGSQAPVPVSEEAPYAPESPYGLHKVMGEQYLALYRRLFGMQCVSLRFFNVYGPGQDSSSPYSGVVAKFVALARTGRQPTIYGDGSALRDFVHVSDVVAAIVRAAEVDTPLPINIATGQGITVAELARAVWAAAGKPCTPVFEPARTGDIQKSLASAERAKNILGWQARVPFIEGIKELFT